MRILVDHLDFNEKGGCEKRIVPKKKERPRVYNELKVFLSVIINL